MLATFVFMIAGWLAAKIGIAWHDLSSSARIWRRYFGVRAGLQSLRQCTIDVDLLMVLAALGAALGRAFRGGDVLFLFRSRCAPAYAIARRARRSNR